jgi:predicted nucleotide-binding protein (sugar kinase/HSP70/actin superfamily)
MADNLFNEYMARIAERIRSKEALDNVLRNAISDFTSIIDRDKPGRPRVGINGEIFLRSNRFSNNDLERECEKAGLEVVVSPIGEWITYITHRNIEDRIREREVKKAIAGYIRKLLQKYDERSVAANFKDFLDIKDPSVGDILALSSQYLSPKCGSEAVLSIGTGIEWMESPEFAGVISVMPHGCMPGGIVAAMSENFSAVYGKPWINLTYDGFLESTNLERINNFAEIIRFCSEGKAPGANQR